LRTDAASASRNWVYLDGFVPRLASLADILGAGFVDASRVAARNADTRI
jgi:hypothetical protein